MRSKRGLTIAVAALLLHGYVLSAQANAERPDPKTKAAHVQAYQKYRVELQRLKELARSAYSDEYSREKIEDCPDAKSNYDLVMCFSKEIGNTKKNYENYTHALRAIEALVIPGEPFTGGPTGTSPTAEERTEEFDAVESTWLTLQKAQCSAAFNAYKGGTIAPIVAASCQLKMMRDRMQELESIYRITENN